MIVFFDTEFTGLIVDPKLISIGLVDESGARVFYAELSDTWRLENAGDDFVRAAVLPQLEGGAALMTVRELGEQLTAWLEAFGGPVKLATDSMSWDWPWLQEIFYEHEAWPANVDGKPLILQFDAEAGKRFNYAVEKAFAGGLRRHHALDDAKANRLGWLAAGVAIEAGS